MDDSRPPSASGQPVPAPGAELSSGAHYRVAFDNSHEAIIILQDGVLRVANPAAARIIEIPLAALVGRPFLELIHPDDQSFVLEMYDRRIAGDTAERSMVARILRASGGIVVLEAHSMPVQWNERPAVLAFLADVTDREQVRSDAEEMSRRLARIAEVAPYFLFIYDYDLGRDIYINRSVPAALGYSPAEAAALGPYPFENLCHPEDMAAALDRDVRWRGFVDGSSLTVDFRLRHRNGEWRWFRSHNTPFLRDARGRIQQILGMTQDITESKRSEELLHRTERLESLGLLAGGIAHDFSNLLTPIVGNIELLLDRLPADSPLRDRALAVSAAADRATELARQLLVYAGRGEIAPRPIDLNSLVEDVVHLLRALATVATPTRLDLAPRLPPISGDSSQLRQVILNLLSNAHDAMGTGGSCSASGESPLRTASGGAEPPARVQVRTRRVDLRPADLGTLLLGDGMRPGPAVVLEVIDNGIGMDAETLERVWEPFFTTKERGRGLGLPSVLGILRAHRAGIALESHPRSGTHFRVYFSEAATMAPADPSLPG
ncbi:MAG: domain S-box protein [Acidobacteriota bacterium]|nr:domain S-box protein [Acidobacteriota bacterium]